MRGALRLPPGVRKTLKSPLGRLLDRNVPDEMLKEALQGKTVYSVGDRVTLRLLRLSFLPDVAVFDWKTKRKPNALSEELNRVLLERGYTFLKCRNPPGQISEDALQKVPEAVERASKGERVALEVEGEEDLLALLFIKHGAEGSVVLYGQPDEGVVVVEVESATIKSIEALLREMEAD